MADTESKPVATTRVRKIAQNPFIASEEPQSLFKEPLPNNAMGGIMGGLIQDQANAKKKEYRSALTSTRLTQSAKSYFTFIDSTLRPLFNVHNAYVLSKLIYILIPLPQLKSVLIAKLGRAVPRSNNPEKGRFSNGSFDGDLTAEVDPFDEANESERL